MDIGGTFTTLDAPDARPGTTTIRDINTRGQIVGFYQDAATGFERSFIAEPMATQVPEPGTLALLGLGLTGLAAARRRRRRS